MKSRAFALFLLAGFLLLGIHGLGQQYSFKNYSVGDGVAQSQVYAMLEDSRGYIWMGTRGGGLSRFDGQNFETFRVSDHLSSNYINCLLEDQAGNLWVGTDAGLSYYDGLAFSADPHAFDQAITSLVMQANGTIWIGTYAGLYRLKGGELQHFSSQHPRINNGIYTLFVDRKDQLWVGNNGGLHLIDEDQIHSYTEEDGLQFNRVRSITEDKTGQLWVHSEGSSISIFNGKSFAALPAAEAQIGTIVNGLFTDHSDNVWVATLDKGMAFFYERDSSFILLNERDGLANNNTRSMLEDRWGNYWFGTSGGGVSKYFKEHFEYYNQSKGLPGDYVYAVMWDHENNLWLGTNALGVVKYDGEHFQHLQTTQGFPDTKVKTMYEDVWGNKWFGTEGKGLFQRTNQQSFTYHAGNGLRGAWIKYITQSADSTLWVATNEGITTFSPVDQVGSGFTLEHIGRSQGLPESRITVLHEDQKGRMWFGTSKSGFGYIQHGKVEVFGKAEGLTDLQIIDMTEDANGYLWVGTRGSLIHHVQLYGDALKFEHFDHSSGLTSTNVFLLETDLKGHVWVGSESGLDEVILDDNQIKKVAHYGKTEGFHGIETTQQAVCEDNQGQLWFGTINGLAKYDPTYKTVDELAPRLSFTAVDLFYESLRDKSYGTSIGAWFNTTETITLPHHQNHLSFDFIGINHRNPTKVKYQWQLVGQDADWSPLNTQSNATYSNISPGQYTFQVKAANADMIWSTPISISFEVTPPFWRTWWFLTAGSIVILCLIIGTFRYRVYQLKKQNQQERERLELEKDVVNLEQKALRLQMNPHFIFNALNSIQGLISQRDAKTARYFLAKFSKLMRMILENSRSTQITLEEEIKTLENYLSLEQFSSGEQFTYEIHFTEDLEPEEVLIPPMMVQPFVENAIIHGVSKLETRPGKIEVVFSLENGHLQCSIQDNGIGRAKAAEVKSQKKQYHKSTALVVTQERLDILNGGVRGPKSLETIDLKGEQGEALGTQVILRIPMSQV